MSDTNNDPFFSELEEKKDFNLKEILFKYFSYWKWFTASLIIAMLTAVVYLKYQTPVYSIKSSILIKDEMLGTGQDAMLEEMNVFASAKLIENEIEILKTHYLMEKVVTSLNLQVGYFTEGQFRDQELYEFSPVRIESLEFKATAYEEPLHLQIIDAQHAELNGQKILLNQYVSTPYGRLKVSLTGKKGLKNIIVKIKSIDAVAAELLSSLTIVPKSETSSVLSLRTEDAKPERGKDVLNQLVKVYNLVNLEDKNKHTASTLSFIEDRLILISRDLTDAEITVESFKAREGITDISAEAGLFLQSVQENDNQLSQIRIQQSVLENIESYVRNKQNASGTVPATLGISDPTLMALIQSLSELESKRAQAMKIVKADNPMVTALDEQIINAKTSLAENLRNLRRTLAITRQQLESRNRQMEGMIRTVPGKERALVDITRQQGIKNDLYVYLLKKREETALSYASATSDSRVVDMARSDYMPVKPVERNIYLVFILMGLTIPFSVIYILHLLNDKIRSRKDIERATNAHIVAEISYAPEHDPPLMLSNSNRNMMGEQIRSLRTNLSFLNPGKSVQSILFTSGMSGEGKSFLSLMLGSSLAIMGKKTIILELDMRKPKFCEVLQMVDNPGLSNYLAGQVSLDEIIYPIAGQENYFIITCGAIPPNPAELLLTDRLAELYRELRDTFDYIITDAPPVGMVTDAQILEQQADVTLFVLRHEYTPKERLKMVDALYREKKFKNLNLIFNGVKSGGRYGYGYGYYGTEKKSLRKKAGTI